MLAYSGKPHALRYEVIHDGRPVVARPGRRQHPASAQIPTSALVRRLLRQAPREPGAPVLTEERAEAIAWTVLAEAQATDGLRRRSLPSRLRCFVHLVRILEVVFDTGPPTAILIAVMTTGG